MPTRAALAGSFAAGRLALAGLGATYALRPARFWQSSLSCPATARPLARLELLFGKQRKKAAPVSEEEWAVFLAAEVTPRFPDGLTVFTGQVQWRGADGIIIKETSRMLVMILLGFNWICEIIPCSYPCFRYARKSAAYPGPDTAAKPSARQSRSAQTPHSAHHIWRLIAST